MRKSTRFWLLAAMTALLAILLTVAAAAETVIYEGTTGQVTVQITDEGTVYLTGSGRTGSMDGTPADKRWNAIYRAAVGDENANIRRVVIGKGIANIGKYILAGDDGNDLNFDYELVFEEGREGPLDIGDYAFARTGLTSIDLTVAKTEKIGKKAFYKAKALTSVTFSGELIQIGQQAFDGCSALETLVNCTGSIKTIMGGAFNNCSALRSATIFAGTAYTYDDNYGVFEGADLRDSLVIEEGVTELTAELFHQTKITSVSLPASLEKIADDAFDNCKRISRFTVAPGNTHFASPDGMTLYRLADDGTATLISFAPRFEGSDTVTVPASIEANGKTYRVTGITGFAFTGYCDNGDSAVKHVVIEAPVTEICDQMFRNSNVETVALPATVTRIGNQAFKDAEHLTALTLGKNVTEIGSSAFFGCAACRSLIFEEGCVLTSVGSDAFNFGEGNTLAEIVNLPAAAAIGGPGFAANLRADASCAVSLAGSADAWNTLLWRVFTMDSAFGKTDSAAVLYEKLRNGSATVGGKSVADKLTFCSATAASCASYAYDIYTDGVRFWKFPAAAATSGKPAHTVDEHTVLLIKKGASAKYEDQVIYICTVCGQLTTADGADAFDVILDDEGENISESIAAVKHVYVYTPDGNGGCQAGSGTMTGTCIFCGRQETGVADPNAHHSGEWTVVSPASCTAPGSRTRVCTVCGESETEEIPALGHDYVCTAGTDKQDGTCTKTFVCRTCNDTVTVTAAHVYGPADLDGFRGGICVCGAAEYGSAAHDWNVPDTGDDDPSTDVPGTEPIDNPSDESFPIWIVIVIAVAAAAVAAAVIVVVKKK